MFRFSELEDAQRDVYFRFPHSIISDGIWRALPKSAHAVLPVIGIHANKTGLAFPSEDRIAGMSGLTCKSVREAVKRLVDVWPGFSVQKYVTQRGKRAKSYRFGKQPADGKKYLAFHRRWIDGGNWHVLHGNPAAWSLYPVMRHFAFAPDYETMAEELDADPSSELRDFYARRPYDYCQAENSVLNEYAGISRNSLRPALAALQQAEFVQWDNEADAWRVHRISERHYKRDWLNAELERRNM